MATILVTGGRLVLSLNKKFLLESEGILLKSPTNVSLKNINGILKRISPIYNKDWAFILK